MFKVIEKGYGRKAAVGIVDPAKDQFVIGFETPNIVYCPVPHGKFAVRIVSKSGFDLVIRQDNKVLLEKKNVEAGVHTFKSGNDGKPFMFSPAPEPPSPDESPKEVDALPLTEDNVVRSEEEEISTQRNVTDDTAVNTNSCAAQDLSPAASAQTDTSNSGDSIPTRLFPESDPPPDALLAPSYGLIIVQIRFCVDEDNREHLPPDPLFEHRLFQLKAPKAMGKAFLTNFAQVVIPPEPPDGYGDFIEPSAKPRKEEPARKRLCNITFNPGPGEF